MSGNGADVDISNSGAEEADARDALPELLDKASSLLEDKVKEIEEGSPDFTDAPFLKFMNVSSIDELYAKSFTNAMQNLELALQGRKKGANK